MTSGVASLFKANGVEWVKGTGRFTGANTIAVEGADQVNFKQAIIATGSFPLRPPIEGLDSPRCVDSTGLLAQTEVPRRLVVLGGGIIGCEFAIIFRRFGSEVTIIEMLPTPDPPGGRRRRQGARQAVLQARDRAPPRDLRRQGRGYRQWHPRPPRRRDDRGRPDARGHRPRADDENLGLEEIGVEFDRRKGIAADEHRRTTHPAHLRRRRLRRLLAARPHRLPRGRGRGRECDGPRGVVDNRGVPRPIYTDPEIAGVGLTEAEAREQYGDDVAVGTFPWVANARAVMQNETVGWVKSIHETRYGELLGLIMVGPHVTDLIEAGTVALDAEATVETVADGMAAHPTLSEAIKEAGLVALGRPIHIPAKRARNSAARSRNHPSACRKKRRFPASFRS